MKNTVLSTTPEIKQASELLEELASKLTNVASEFIKFQSPEEYRADVEALHLLQLTICHVESVVSLAQQNLALLPSAAVISRSAFETAMNALWMLEPEDPSQRQVRLIAFMQEEIDFYDRYIKKLNELGVDSANTLKIEQDRDKIKLFREAVIRNLPLEYKSLPKMPNIFDMLRSMNREVTYPFYRILCQYVHGTHAATWRYKTVLDNPNEIEEFLSPKKWHSLLHICGYSLEELGCKFLSRLGHDPELFLSESFRHEFWQAIARIATS
ncbi:DUF5677 domain-containing protein [Trichocoleus sp. ST-U3]